MRENILQLLTQLRLKGMEDVLERELDRAQKKGKSCFRRDLPPAHGGMGLPSGTESPLPNLTG